MTEVFPGYFAMFESPPPEALPILAALIADYRETDQTTEHFAEVIAANGLQVIQ